MVSSPRHPPQSLATPLNITITPNNSNPPQVSMDDLQHDYIENSMLGVLRSVTLYDRDETCDEDVITAAQIRVELDANDNAYETLSVSKLTQKRSLTNF